MEVKNSLLQLSLHRLETGLTILDTYVNEELISRIDKTTMKIEAIGEIDGLEFYSSNLESIKGTWTLTVLRLFNFNGEVRMVRS